MTRAVGYVRISKADHDKTDEQQHLSIRQQREAVARACEAKGWELVHVYEDFAASGADDDRVDFGKLQDTIDAKGAEVVVVTRLDRLSRKAWRLLWLIEEKGWNIYAVEQNFDSSEPEGWLAMAIHALMADYERRLIGKRTRQALAQRKREGKHNGRRSSIPTELEDRIASLYDDGKGMSASAIAALLESEGAPRPTTKSKGWHHGHVIAAARRSEVRSLVGVAS